MMHNDTTFTKTAPEFTLRHLAWIIAIVVSAVAFILNGFTIWASTILIAIAWIIRSRLIRSPKRLSFIFIGIIFWIISGSGIGATSIWDLLQVYMIKLPAADSLSDRVSISIIVISAVFMLAFVRLLYWPQLISLV
jgi:hypothetical protein